MAEETSRRDDISAAFDKVEKANETPQPELEKQEVAPDAVVAQPEPIGAPKPAGDKPRDEKGRYLSPEKAKIGAEPPPKEVQPELPLEAAKPPAEPTPTPQPEKPKVRPPSSWKPTAREGWDKVPPEIQEEVIRVDREIRKTMQEAAEAREMHQKLQEVIRPYEPLIRAEGVEPIQAINNLFRTTAMLATGPQQTKAQIVAGIIKTYGVDIATLDALLAGQAPPNGVQQQPQWQPPNPQQFRDPRLDALLERANAQVEQQATTQLAEVENEEFFEDVREEMADILDLAAKRGLAMNARDAYNRAVSWNPEINRVLEQRKAAANATSTQRAMAAAASVRGQPTAGPPAQTRDQNWTEALNAAFDKHSSSR